MRKSIIVLFAILLCANFAHSQETKGLEFDFLVAPVKLTFDGDKTVLNTPAFVGAAADVNLFGLETKPGLYISFGIDTSKESDFQLGAAANVKFFKAFGVGVFYDFWLEGRGIVGFKKENTGLLISLDLSL